MEIGYLELADLKELKFWNLNLEINTMPHLGTLKFCYGNLDFSIGMNCQTEIERQILTSEDEKVLPR